VPERYCRHWSRPLASWGQQCDEAGGKFCVRVDESPLGGLLNFEHIGVALLTVLQTLLLQDWERPMLAVMEAVGAGAAVHFVLIIVLGSLFLLEYTVAILCMTYLEVIKEDTEDDMATSSEKLLMQVELPAVFADTVTACSGTPASPP
jgi:hypothetical protein